MIEKMPKVVFMPHHDICPEGAVVEGNKGETVCEAALRSGLRIEHACEMSCACTTCHVHVREGYDTLSEPDELEDDYLDKAPSRPRSQPARRHHRSKLSSSSA